MAPDIEVDYTHAEVIKGHDPQLERAVSYILEALQKNPPPHPRKPVYPNYYPNAQAPDTDKVLHYLRLPTFLNGKIGPASAAGGVSGTMNALSLRDVTVNFLGVSGRASGTLTMM